ncbi:hypothetical protein BBO99_00004995 [Phytophthora kernoviae]|uniref:AB hydrolase-1 domain-containing protein n=2 Tax=Phytophthora kernoviae TaxID=325452 RepID=A0A421GPR3_9STRA|nr:hypothetical protein G195_005111 [Phytophthora kernoviae 00238/432]KAG2523996.1 hypothetical protein JM18_004533 [Phytophthora kernoviae]KAG2524367.1 hypothetical protein JM16_005008 [Phytophthora kernoviae]RLN06593.1 hypothetical protein BBI17_005120 [Phytophthora kernoviae]RLN79801.1 hypothetical protein BBO99_00004995 [Phytophthora kernoviae]
MTTPTASLDVIIPRIFASSADYRLQVSTDSYVFFEDSNPDADAGTTIAICLPGIGDTRRQYRFIAPILHEQLGLRVLVGDLRGFGDSTAFDDNASGNYSAYSPESTASDVMSLMEKLTAVDPKCSFVLVGNSLSAGSMVLATVTAKKAASGPRIRALVLLGPILRDSPMDSWFRPLSHLLFRPLYGAWFWTSYYKTLYPVNSPDDLEAEVEILKNHLKTRKDNVVNVGRYARASKVEVASAIGDLGKIPSVPVIAFFGQKDPDYADLSAELKWFTEAVPHAQHFEIEDGGHYPHVEHPERRPAPVLALFYVNFEKETRLQPLTHLLFRSLYGM